MEEKKQPTFQFEMTPEVAQGQYANLAVITHSSSDFVFDFARMLPGAKPTINSRVVMGPEHAKRLLMALQENIYKYEQQFGKIQVNGQNNAGRTIAPFGSGEA